MKHFVVLFLVTLSLLACKKKEAANPYLDASLQPPPPPVDTLLMGPYSFASLYRDIFQPTCSNSGCHDGNFEPDFRTIESSYNTLVYQPIIKNNTAGAFSYRVVPGNADASVLLVRLTTDIDGISGIMPLSVDPGSDYPVKKSEYIERIRQWIERGALDVLGNPPVSGPGQPKIDRP
jgi:hypothetical protein